MANPRRKAKGFLCDITEKIAGGRVQARKHATYPRRIMVNALLSLGGYRPVGGDQPFS
jgi:hypothetical protein